MPPRDLLERTRLFSHAVLNFCRLLPKTDEAQEIARQLRRAGNSVRSNYRASKNGRSRDEFAAKLGEVYEEADEARDWLQYLHDAGIGSDSALLQEAQELTKIFSKSVQTANENNRRLKTLRKRNR